MKIVFVSHSFYSPYFVVGSHQLARQLARRGHQVWHISAIPFFHLINPARRDYRVRLNRFFHGVINREANLREAVIRPLLPWQITRTMQDSGNYFLRLSDIGMLVSTHADLQEADVLIIDEPRLKGIEDYIHADALYYRPTDLYAEIKHDPTIRRAEAALLAKCKGLVATSELVLDSVQSLRPEIPALLLTNGVDPDDFTASAEEPRSLRGFGRPRVIYVGAIDERLDAGAIKFLADRFPQVQFVVIGDGSRFARARAMHGQNIHVLGVVPHAELNAYLRYCDVGLLPLAKSRPNEGRSPMKIYEYGISGLPVLASRTPEMDRRKESFVELYSDHEEAARQLRVILDTPRDRGAIVRQCAHHAWSVKAAQLEEFMTGTLRSAAPVH